MKEYKKPELEIVCFLLNKIATTDEIENQILMDDGMNDWVGGSPQQGNDPGQTIVD